MSDFDNVSVVKEANIYFDGGVTSRTIIFATGEEKALGVMLPGEYRFNTAKKELMEIQSGVVEVLLPGGSNWLSVSGGESFEVPGNAAFDIKVSEITDYCCSFLD